MLFLQIIISLCLSAIASSQPISLYPQHQEHSGNEEVQYIQYVPEHQGVQEEIHENQVASHDYGAAHEEPEDDRKKVIDYYVSILLHCKVSFIYIITNILHRSHVKCE